MSGKRRFHGKRQHSNAIFVAFAFAHDEQEQTVHESDVLPTAHPLLVGP
jgi:hypothetical protein